MSTIKPTYLYIKTHTKTGMKYFGMTTKDPYVYKGSGRYWLKHINKHGLDFIDTTEVFGPFTDKSELVSFATNFSEENNIVESKDWANLMPENGTNGGPVKNNYLKHYNTLPRSAEHKRKISESMKINNYKKVLKCKIGDLTFPSLISASKHFNVTVHTIYRWRKQGKVIII